MTMQFNNFSPQAFERMVQALAVPLLGKGIVVFGNGPDGAREAAYEGTVSYPNEDHKWDGYIIIQAKCRENLKHGTSDAKWLSRQIRADLEKFLDPKRRLRKPEYYIVASNVSLSAVPKTGGKAILASLLDSYKVKLGLKEWAIWSAEELTVFLENFPEVRRAYSAWVTPSDVLSNLLTYLDLPDLARLLPLSLSRDLRSERDARLKDAGQEAERIISLDETFIDLPLAEGPIFTPWPSEKSHAKRNVLAELFSLSTSKCDPDAVNSWRERNPQAPLFNRIVLLGGPGQGKSTLGQFTAQVFRARILENREEAAFNPQTLDLIRPILERAEAEGLPVSGPVRFPVRIDLPAFADEYAIAPISMIEFYAKKLSRNVGTALEASHLRSWFSLCPALIILDGLDEVPPSSNRGDIINSINQLWDDMCYSSADIIIVVTSRPQGYNHDLDPRYWQHWSLDELTAPKALEFAKRLADVRVSDEDRRREILGELTRASGDPATAALISSPLQVSILFGIALLKGIVPQDRWELFNRYYSLLRDREAAKRTSDANLIREHMRQINILHHQAGFLLHVMAEEKGNSRPFLTIETLGSIISGLLRDEEYSENEIGRITRELVRLATERLVLLASRVEGQIAFDVRSLQEFMAAAQLTTVGGNSLPNRLRAICYGAHWRHVFRIATSRIFSDSEFNHYRDDVLSVCHQLDNGDFGDDGRLIRAGAHLAAELLSDGIASAPRYKRLLLRRSLDTLDLGSEFFERDICNHYDSDTEEVFREEISRRLGVEQSNSSLGAWTCLLHLVEKSVPWAEAIALHQMPQESSAALALIGSATRGIDTVSKVVSKLRQCQLAAGEEASLKFGNASGLSVSENTNPLCVMPSGYFVFNPEHEFHMRIFGDGVAIASCTVSSLSKLSAFSLGEKSDEFEKLSSWEFVRTLSKFAKEPSKDRLADVIEFHNPGSPFFTRLAWRFPWIIRTCLDEIDDGIPASQLSDEIRNGSYGDFMDWLAAEERWRERGASLAEFELWNSGRYLSARIAHEGVPSFTGDLGRLLDKQQGPLLAKVLGSISDRRKRVVFIERFMAASSPIADFNSGSFSSECFTEMRAPENVHLLELAAFHNSDWWKSEDFCEWCDRAGRQHIWTWPISDISTAAKAFRRDISKRGLISVIAFGFGNNMYLSGTALQIADLPDDAFLVKSTDEEPVRLAAVLLKVHFGRWEENEIEGISDEIIRNLPDHSPLPAWFGHVRPTCYGKLITVLLKKAKAKPDLRVWLLGELARLFDARKSALVSSGDRKALGLPSLVN